MRREGIRLRRGGKETDVEGGRRGEDETRREEGERKSDRRNRRKKGRRTKARKGSMIKEGSDEDDLNDAIYVLIGRRLIGRRRGVR